MKNPALFPNPGNRRYETLDAMRGLCAVLVALLHFDFALGTGIVARHGWLSVDMFFVLSGFVIALKYEDRLRAGNGFGAFIGARAARLLPVQMLGTLVVAISLSLFYLSGRLNTPGVNPASLATAFVFASLLVPIGLSPAAGISFLWISPFPANPPLWSLQGEWLVNIVYGRWLSPARTWLLMVLWAILTFYLVDHVFSGKRVWDLALQFELVPCLVRAAIGFLAGVMLCRAHRRGILNRLPLVSPPIVFGLWFIVCWVPDRIPLPVFECVVTLVVVPLCVALLVRGEQPVPGLFAGLGRLSYPLYASHYAVINLALIWMTPGRQHNMLFLIPMLFVSLLLAWGIGWVAAMLQMIGLPKRSLAMVHPSSPSSPASVDGRSVNLTEPCSLQHTR